MSETKTPESIAWEKRKAALLEGGIPCSAYPECQRFATAFDASETPWCAEHHHLSDQQAAAMVLSAYRRWDPDGWDPKGPNFPGCAELMLQLEQALIRCGYVLFDGDLTEAGKALLREHG